ncbi:RNA polymerase sigma factor [Tabrizicola sp.]|uniref:RNA polymerase sigma factor n=1 Tax=Tabrizicola sp. TaxID=2005166 RepID=UPI003F3289A2
MRRWKRRCWAKKPPGNRKARVAMSAALKIDFPPTVSVGGCMSSTVRGFVPPSYLSTSKSIRGFTELPDQTRFRKDLVQLLPRLRRFALTLCAHAADADDLVQTACERAILKSSQWMPGTRLDSWVYTMMRNLWFSELRSRRVRTGAGQVDASESDELSTEVGAAEILQGSQIAAMIRSLPEGLSATLLLVSIEGYSYQEAADVLDIPIGTVMSRMSKARQLMKDKLARATGEAVL